MNKTSGWLTVAVTLAGVAGAFYFSWTYTTQGAQMIRPFDDAAPPARIAKADAPKRYPLQANKEDALAGQPLPVLNESDPPVSQALSELVGPYWLDKVFRLQETVRNIVATVDNLPRSSVAARLLPTRPVEGSFATSGDEDGLTIAADNAWRYTPFVKVADMMDAKEMVATYVHFYPLFQLAYQDLGYPKGYFNDRLIEVIDHLLAAPEPSEPVKLVQPHILYLFADPAMEAASAGHKIMMRMGSANEAKVKAKLRQIRRELIAASVSH
jgi:hypothetical protein